MELKAKAAIKVLKPVREVFEAIVDPQKLANYFVSSSSGRMEPGKTLTWRWADADADGPVRVDRVEQDKLIVFRWDAGGRETTVTITLEQLGNDVTKVSAVEDGWPKDDQGIAALAGNTEGWANFMACLKAFAEHGINLRKGAF